MVPEKSQIVPFTQDFPKKESYDYISIMAVLEHIPNSLEYFLGNISNALNDTGSLYIEVPNIAYYYKRVNLLKGKSPIPDIEVIYKSESPFIGHHHEYSTNELIRLNKLAGFKVNKLERYNYSIVPSLIYYL